MKAILYSLLAAVAMMSLAGCDRLNNKSLPEYPVRINLGNYALWTTYGVVGVGDYRIFNRDKKLPSNFAYDVNTFTGYGGVLLVMEQDIYSTSTGTIAPHAYDLSCPVEGRADVVVGIDEELMRAVCPQCKSQYDVFFQGGRGVSGSAASHNKGLNPYKVRATGSGGYIISNY